MLNIFVRLARGCLLAAIAVSGGCSGPSGPATSDSGACMAPMEICEGRCVSSASDPQHCGGCGRECAPGESCVAGDCAVSCPAGETSCGGTCVDTVSDPAHCGGCDRACAADMECRSGGCACPEGLIDCGGECVDPETDPNHCGMCDRACQADETCGGGSCLCGGRACVGDERCLESGTCGCSFGSRVECSCGAVICCSVPDRCVERCEYHCA